jgi:putative serine protease PepD
VLTESTRRFCVDCGWNLVEGFCARCDDVADPAEGAAHEPLRAGSSRARAKKRVIVGLGIALVVALNAHVASVAFDARSSAATAERQVDALLVEVDDLREQADAQHARQEESSASIARLGGRLAVTETAISEDPDAAEIIARVLSSVFTVETEDSSGSAFVLSSDGGTSRLVTNAHVINDVYRAGGRGVRLLSGERTLTGRIVAVSNQYDLALIEVDVALPVLRVATERVVAGDAVFVVGSPLGFEGTVSSGLASSYRVEDGVEFLQFSAAVNPGNSGGPVVDADGRLIGVATMKIVGFGIEGLSFAVPVDRVCSTFESC